MEIDWTDAPNFGRTTSLVAAIDALHMIRQGDVVFVETGTTRGDLGGGVIGDGWATLAFGWYCRKYGGEVYTIDMLEEAIEECKRITEEYEDVISYIVGDSVEFLQAFEKPIDFLYLDSADDPQVALDELLAVYDKLSERAMIVIDDTHNSMTIGKGVLVCKYLLKNKWNVLLDGGGQVIFSNVSDLTFTPNSVVPSRDFLTAYEYIQDGVEDGNKLRIEDYGDKATVWYSIFQQWLPQKEAVPKTDGIRKVLDLGCNTGYNTRKLEEEYGYAVGVDMNDKLIKLSVLNHDKCYTMRVENLKFDDESFSMVVAKDVIEHSINPDATLEEIYRVLVDGGYMVCMIPLDGEERGIDDIALHPTFNHGNYSHIWKATLSGVLIRLYNLGFSDLEISINTHSGLFGVARTLGDRVLTVRARKIKDIIKVPPRWLVGFPYWCAFLTMSCNSNCDYCLQYLSKDEFIQAKLDYARNSISSHDWITFYNRLQRRKNQQISIVGGEPTIYSGFFDIVNGLEGYYKTITTNLSTPCFEDIPNKFEAILLKKEDLRINTSFHPKLISIDDFCNRVHQLRDTGFFVDQIAMVDHPTSNFKYYAEEFVKRGLAINPQTYLGKVDGTLLPHPDSDLAKDHKEHSINNYDLYKEGFSYEKKQEVLCTTTRFLVAPNGSIFKCHYHLYSNRSPLGSIFDGVLPQPKDFFNCTDFGYCNPCDFPHAAFRPMHINLPNILLDITGDANFVSYVSYEVEQEYTQEMKDFLIAIMLELYSSNDPYWELYHNDKIKTIINEFIAVGGHKDNSNALFLAKSEGGLFRLLSGGNGVNIYRLLNEESLLKYMDALSCVVAMLFAASPPLMEKLYTKELCDALGTQMATITSSLGLATHSSKKIHFIKKKIHSTERGDASE